MDFDVHAASTETDVCVVYVGAGITSRSKAIECSYGFVDWFITMEFRVN